MRIKIYDHKLYFKKTKGKNPSVLDCYLDGEKQLFARIRAGDTITLSHNAKITFRQILTLLLFGEVEITKQ